MRCHSRGDACNERLDESQAEYIDPMFKSLLDMVGAGLPAQCEVCGTWPSKVLCEACTGSFLRPLARCQSCALPAPVGQAKCGACLLNAPALDACLTAVSYAYPWSACVTRFKYDGQAAWARPLAQLMAQASGAAQALQSCDLLLPMPLSAKRLAERGFNQAHELAKRLAPGKVRNRLLLRVRDTAPQEQLGRAERERNMRGAFMVAPEAAPLLRGKRLMLVDDVMTTGASINEAAAALKQCGAAWVTGLVFARTDSP